MNKGLTLGLLACGWICLWGPAAMALTTDQVLALKKAGVTDETIQLMIRQEAAATENGQDRPLVQEIKDKDGNTVIVYSTEERPRDLDRAEQEKVDRAWDMLRIIIIDGRKP